jgi:hypothetical protein
MLVAVVVHDQVQVQALGRLCVEHLQEGQVLLVAVPALAAGDDGAVGHVQCGE